jgi:hypothetical protein
LQRFSDTMRPIRFVALLAGAFLFGGGSAEVAVRTHAAVERARADREVGAAGQLVALELHDGDGALIARPRLIAPLGRRAELLLHDPLRPDDVRVGFRVEATREPSGDIAIDFSVWLPDRAVSARGKVQLTPGVEQSIALGDGQVIATWLAMPVPSAAFDAWLVAQEARRAAPKAT